MFKVSIFDADKKLFEGLARQVSLPGVDGYFSVMDFHAPMVSLLKEGNITVDRKVVAIRKGVVRINNNELVVLLER